MDLALDELIKVLASKGVKELFHSNSVATSCSFIRQGALMSRKRAETLGLPQTSQKSDNADKEYGVWDDIFMDSVDIHSRGKKRNHYGPILFTLDVAVLTSLREARFRVTKLNPTKWNGKSEQQRWFQSIEELDADYVFGRFDHMLVVRTPTGEVPFGSFLKGIKIDSYNEKSSGGNIPKSVAWGALRCAMAVVNKNIPIEFRKCENGCRCHLEYRADPNMSRKMFDVGITIQDWLDEK